MMSKDTEGSAQVMQELRDTAGWKRVEMELSRKIDAATTRLVRGEETSLDFIVEMRTRITVAREVLRFVNGSPDDGAGGIL